MINCSKEATLSLSDLRSAQCVPALVSEKFHNEALEHRRLSAEKVMDFILSDDLYPVAIVEWIEKIEDPMVFGSRFNTSIFFDYHEASEILKFAGERGGTVQWLVI